MTQGLQSFYLSHLTCSNQARCNSQEVKGKACVQLLLTPEHGLGPQCPLLAPKSPVDPLTLILHIHKEKAQLWETVWMNCEQEFNIHYNIPRQTDCFYVFYCSLPFLVSFIACFPLFSPFFQVQWSMEKCGEGVWWREIVVNSRVEVYILTCRRPHPLYNKNSGCTLIITAFKLFTLPFFTLKFLSVMHSLLFKCSKRCSICLSKSLQAVNNHLFNIDRTITGWFYANFSRDRSTSITYLFDSLATIVLVL